MEFEPAWRGLILDPNNLREGEEGKQIKTES